MDCNTFFLIFILILKFFFGMIEPFWAKIWTQLHVFLKKKLLNWKKENWSEKHG